MRKPERLRRGDRILLICPSSPLAGGQTVEAVAAAVERLGFRVSVGASCRSETACGYAAATPEVRAGDLNRGFADPEIRGIWCVRGGSSAWQLPPLLDYRTIAENPKAFIGFSDVTTLHLAIQRRCGLITFHGPTANRALDWEEEGFSWASLQAALGMAGSLEIANPPGQEIEVIRSGQAGGLLTGGNLSLAVQSLGTPWQMETEGRVLFLEDVGEEVYALDRMLSQLRAAGLLERAAGLVFGAFTKCSNAYREAYGPEALLRDFFADWPKPVLANVRSAHCCPMVTLPFGAMCRIDGERLICV